jgi:hypothetical protein
MNNARAPNNPEASDDMNRDFFQIWSRISRRVFRVVGVGGAIVAAIIGVFVLTDLMRITHFGYPDWAVVPLAAVICPELRFASVCHVP